MKYELITTANAQQAEQNPSAQEQFSFTSFVPLILIFVVFYFLIIRPQNKKMKEHQILLNNLKVGDKITTNGGIIGIIRKINDEENILEIEIADNVTIKILRAYVTDLTKKEESKKSKK